MIDDKLISRLKSLNKDRLQHQLTIHVMRRFNAGRLYYYPMDEASKSICSFLKQKTLVQADIDRLKAMAEALHLSLTIVAIPDSTVEEI